MSATDRDELAKMLYDAGGFHAADRWGAEGAITRGRYEGLAEEVIASGWLARVREQAARDALLSLAGEMDLSWNRGHDRSVHPYSHLLRERAGA